MDKSPLWISNAEAKRIKDAVIEKLVRSTAKQRIILSSDHGEEVHRFQNGVSSNLVQVTKSATCVRSVRSLSSSTSADLDLPSPSKKSDNGAQVRQFPSCSSSNIIQVKHTDTLIDPDRSFSSVTNTDTNIPPHIVVSSVNSEVTNNASLSVESHYRRNFLVHLVEIQTNENLWHLFNHDDMDVFNEFIALLSEAQSLYVRLLDVEHSWLRESSMKYPEISEELRFVVNVLIEKQFLTTDISRENIEELIDLLTLSELKSLCKCFSLRIDGRKDILAKSLIEFSNNHKLTREGFEQDIKTVMREKIVIALGRIVKLTCRPRQLFLRTMLLYSLPLSKSMEMDGRIPLLKIMSQVTTKYITYPDYPLKPLHRLFSSRESLIRFQEALVLEATIKKKFMSKSFDEVVNLYNIACIEFVKILGNQVIRDSDVKLPLYLRTFTSGTVLARALYCCMECLRTKRMYTKMIFAYETLLSQELYLPNCRGKWYNDLAYIFQHHLKDIPKTIDFLIEALTDSSLTAVDRVQLSNQGLLVANRKKKNKAEAEKNAILISMLSRVKDPKEFSVQARCFPSKVGGAKVSYIYESEEGIGQILSSVEEVVVLHHKQFGYVHGIHAENAIGISIFGILFWDIIYKKYIPHVFICPYQKSPLDLKSGEFYSNREELIKQRVEEIKEKWSNEEMKSQIKKIWCEEKEKESIVSWKIFKDLNQFQDLVESIGRNVISKICVRMAKEFPIACNGFPGVVIWNQTTKMCKFILVKYPGDKLSPLQKSWLAFLDAAGGDAIVCCVNGTKSMKRKSEVADNTDPWDLDGLVDVG